GTRAQINCSGCEGSAGRRKYKLLAVNSSSVREIAPPGKAIAKEPVSAAKSKLPRKVNTYSRLPSSIVATMLTALVIARVRSLAAASIAMSFDGESDGDGESAGA